MKKSRLLLLSFLLINFWSNAQIPTIGLQAYYTFSNNTFDESGLNNNAIAFGCSYSEDRFGNLQSSLSLNGINDSIEMPVSGFTPCSGDFTISIWVKSKFPYSMEFLDLGEAVFSSFLNYGGGIGALALFEAGSYSLYGSKTSKITNNKWHNLIITKDNGLLSLFLDKNLIDTLTFNNSFGNGESFFIGKLYFNYISSYHRFNGEIDDIAFYNRALTHNELSELFHDGQTIILQSPCITDAYPFNSFCNIKWKNLWSITAFTAEYSLDNINWNLISNNITGEDSTFLWNLNFDIGTNVFFRFSETGNPTENVVTNFIISEYHWELVNNVCNYSQRDGSGLLVFKNKLWYIGGWGSDWVGPGMTTSEIWSSSDGIEWKFELDAPWPTRHTPGWVVFQDKMWVVGGDGNSGILNKDVWNSSDGIHWNKIIDSIPFPERVLFMTAIHQNKIVVFGGQQITDFWAGATDTTYNDVWASIDGVNWEALTLSAPWTPRGQMQSQCVDNNDTLWLLGGSIYNLYYFNDIWNSYDGTNWNRVLEFAPWCARQYFQVEYFDNKMWVIAGNEGDNFGLWYPEIAIANGDLNDVWYSSNGVDWYELKNTPWPERHAASSAIFNSALWITGGYENDIWKLVK